MALTLDGTAGITASGNITGNYILGNGSQLSGIITSVSSLSNGSSNVAVASSGGNVTVGVGGTPSVAVFSTAGANVAGTLGVTGNITGGNLSGTSIVGTLTTAAQTNITSVGTLGTLSVTGNANTGNLGATTVVATNLTGALTTASQTNITSVGTLGSLSVTGNANTGNLGATTVVATNLTGTLQTAAQTGITSVGTLGTLSVSGNITGGNLLINTDAVITGNLTVQGNTTTINSNVITTNDLNITVGNNQSTGAALNNAGIDVGSNNLATWRFNNATTSWQSNIAVMPTANGTLTLGGTSNYWGAAYVTSLTASGNVTGGNLNTAGNVTASYLFGNASQLTGISSNKIFNGTSEANIGASGGNANISIGGVANVVVVTSTGANITGTLNATGNANVGNIGGTNAVFTNLTGTLQTAAQPNITSVGTLTSLASSGSITGRGGLFLGNTSTGNTIWSVQDQSGTIVQEYGRTDGVASSPAFDFHSGATATDYDARIQATGGTGVTGQGNLSLQAANFNITATTIVTGNISGGNISTSGSVTSGSLILNNGLADGGGLVLKSFGFQDWEIDQSSGNVRFFQPGTTYMQLSNVGLSVTGNITAGNLLTSGNIVDTGALSIITAASGNVNLAPNGTNVLVATTTGANITGTLNATGDVTFGGNLIDTGALTISTSSNGNITLSPNGTGVIIASKDIINGQANGVGNIGSATTYFNTVFAKATSAQYADLAEKYTADAEYAPGTVLHFGGPAEVTLCNIDMCSRVAGVVTTDPAYLMNSHLESAHTAAIALQGRVPTKVMGTTRKGDMMVSTGNGYARAEADPRIGTVIGKALEDFDGDIGTIEVAVGRL